MRRSPSIEKGDDAIAQYLREREQTWASRCHGLRATCAFIAVLIPPTFQAAKLDTSIKQYATMAGEFTNLRDRFRLTAEYGSLKPFDEFEAAFTTLYARLEKARARTLTPPHPCFLLARRQWQKGYYKPDEDHRSGKSSA